MTNKSDGVKKRKERDELIRIGSMMANLCFNLKQMKSIPEGVRRPAEELQKAWDNVRAGRDAR